MNENNVLELHELDELKAAYNLMDERLDGQEIVSDEQLREVMMCKFTDIRENLKEGLIWGNLIFVPVIAWYAWANTRLTLLGIILLGVYWVISLIFRFVLLRRTKKEDYGSYNLKTLVEKESRYSNSIMWCGIVAVIFLVAFSLQMFIGKGRNEVFVFIVLALTILIPVIIRWLVIKYKYNGQAIDPTTGKPRKLGGKWFTIIGGVLFCLASCLFLVGSVMNVLNSTGWLGLLKGLDSVSFFMASVVLVLGILHQKEKITVSRRLLIVLTVLAIAFSASVAGIATLKDIAELNKVGTLLSTVIFSEMGLWAHKKRKS